MITDQMPLFATDGLEGAQQHASGVRASAPPAAASDAALSSDGYGWLAQILPAPDPLVCERCQQPMVLPAVPVMWTCPRCHPQEAR